MRYNADIAHCSDCQCPLSEDCLRFKLSQAWDKINPKPMASFIATHYDCKTEKCSMFRPIRIYETK